MIRDSQGGVWLIWFGWLLSKEYELEWFELARWGIGGFQSVYISLQHDARLIELGVDGTMFIRRGVCAWESGLRCTSNTLVLSHSPSAFLNV